MIRKCYVCDALYELADMTTRDQSTCAKCEAECKEAARKSAQKAGVQLCPN